MVQRKQLSIWIGIAIAVIIIVTLVAAPRSNKLLSGSTYGRNPDGYGAWYAFMAERQTPVKRWQKPFTDFTENEDVNKGTFIRINSQLDISSLPGDLVSRTLIGEGYEWVQQGNTFVILGVAQPATAANFSTLQSYNQWQVKIETTRRPKNENDSETILGDRFGAVVWQKKVGDGQIILVTTPYLAANAYQEFADNYEFLAELVSQKQPIWVDEYIHGYKDLKVNKKEKKGDLLSYFLQTPLFPFAVQLLILVLVAIAAQLRRFGKPIMPTTIVVDNSQAYIEALAGVLEKANCSDFVLETIGKDEQLKLQKNLGLGRDLLDEKTLVTAWQQETGSSTTFLRQLLQIAKQKGSLSESKLQDWAKKWQEILSKEIN
jgi:hypothetical protein